MGLIFNPYYIPPQPIPQVEEMIRQELARIDPLLDILWIDEVYPNEVQEVYEGRYALIVRWPSTDGRWIAVREEGYTEAYDLLGWFCEDVSDAESVPQDPYSMMSLVYDLLHNADNEEAPWYDRMKQVFDKNLDKMRENKQMLDDEIEEIADRTYVEDFEYSNPRVGYGD
jgi:hypothetical protein